MRWMEIERAALVETLRGLDPTAPTLCEGWDARRLLAHLVQREHAPRQQLSEVLAKEAPGQEKHLTTMVEQADTPAGYAALVERFAAGTGPLHPLTWLGDTAQLVEYVVHHEDLRRGSGQVPPRSLPEAQDAKLFQQLGLMGRLLFRSSPVGVTLVWPGHPPVTVRRGAGILLTGEPAELALYLNGRRTAAAVALDGSPSTIAEFEQWLHRKN